MNFHDLTLGKCSALELEKVSAERFIFTER
jgi:hypothetical protein